MSDTSNHIAKTKQELTELENLKSELSDKKVSFTPHALGLLMQTIRDGIEEMCDNQKEQKLYDDTLGKQIGDAVEKVITNFAKLKAPVVNISSPQVNVDLKPIADKIAENGKNMVELVEKMGNGNNSPELMRLITAVANQQLILIEKGFQQIDYKDDIGKIVSAINDSRREVVKLKLVKNGYNTELVPEYKK